METVYMPKPCSPAPILHIKRLIYNGRRFSQFQQYSSPVPLMDIDIPLRPLTPSQNRTRRPAGIRLPYEATKQDSIFVDSDHHCYYSLAVYHQTRKKGKISTYLIGQCQPQMGRQYSGSPNAAEMNYEVRNNRDRLISVPTQSDLEA